MGWLLGLLLLTGCHHHNPLSVLSTEQLRYLIDSSISITPWWEGASPVECAWYYLGKLTLKTFVEEQLLKKTCQQWIDTLVSSSQKGMLRGVTAADFGDRAIWECYLGEKMC